MPPTLPDGATTAEAWRRDLPPTWLPERLNPHAMSLGEGLRAAASVGVIVVLDLWLQSPVLSAAALAALLTCIGDIGGPIRPRAMAALSFAVLGGVAYASFTALRGGDPYLATALATLAIFAAGFARVWGPAATGVGVALTMAIVIGVGRPVPPELAAESGIAFMLGCGWAAVMTMAIWRLDPGGASEAALARAWAQVDGLAADLLTLARDGASEDWAHRSRVREVGFREAIEAARGLCLDSLRSRGNAVRQAQRRLVAIDRAEDVFGVLMALLALLESPLAPRAEVARLLSAMQARPLRGAADVEALQALPLADPALRRLVAALAVKLRAEAPPAVAEDPRPWRDAVWAPLVANFSPRSAVLRHATRCALVGGVTLLVNLLWPHPVQLWLTVALVLTMQPFATVTWRRALESILGTMVGAAVAAGLVAAVPSPGWILVVYPLLCGAAFALRGVSYGLFIAFLTPCMLILMENLMPGLPMWETAALRAVFTVAGGLLAVAASSLLWPSWETARIGPALSAAFLAHADYAAAVLGGQDLRSARRAAGLANSNLETSIARRLQEPAWHKAEGIAPALAADATLRRVGVLLAGIAYLGGAGDSGAWRGWVPAAFGALGRGEPLPARPEGAPPPGRMAALVREVEALA